MTDDRHLTEAQARRLWQRAAELQADAARMLEERSEGLARRDEAGETSAEGFSLAHVRQAALEAGISPEFVDRAIDEVADDSEAGAWARRIVGDGPRSLESSRVFEHPAEVVFASMQRVLPRLRLNLVDTRGGDPLEGGWMHFDLPTVGFHQESDRLLTDLYHWADVRELHVRLAPLGEDRCQVTVRAPLGYSRKLGGWVLGALAPVGGLFAALITGAIASNIVPGLGLGTLAEVLAVWGPAAGAFGLGTAGGLKGLRVVTRAGWGKGRSALDRLLGSIATDVRTGGAFQPSAAPPPPPGISLKGLLDG